MTQTEQACPEKGETGWEPSGVHVRSALRGLTRRERQFVTDGCIHGDFQMRTVQSLKRKGMFYLHIDSPNGRCGLMKLTPLGENVRALIKAQARGDQ